MCEGEDGREGNVCVRVKMGGRGMCMRVERVGGECVCEDGEGRGV